jgi:hypothetical protein
LHGQERGRAGRAGTDGSARPLARAGGTRGLRRAVRATVLALAATACAEASAGVVMEGFSESAEDVIRTALTAVEHQDRVALAALLVTREEYETILWPELPDRQYTPFEFVWSLASTNNRKGLRQLLAEFGGVSLELVSVTFDGEPEVHDHFTIYPDARVRVRRKDDGIEGTLPSFDVLVKVGGGWKLMNYDEL